MKNTFKMLKTNLRMQFFKFSEGLNKRQAECLAKINSVNSVSIHVRRGDYLKNPANSEICSFDYYQKAQRQMAKRVQNCVFFIFTNDPQWCKENMTRENTHLVECNQNEDSFKDMWFISECKHQIIANSTFSWWGAYLNNNKDKIVVCPKQFSPNKKTDIFQKEIYLSDWIKL